MATLAAPPVAAPASPVDSVAALLKSLRLERYYDTLVNEGYDDLAFLSEATLDDLLEMGMKKGHARAMLCAIRPGPVPIAMAVPAFALSTADESNSLGIPPVAAVASNPVTNLNTSSAVELPQATAAETGTVFRFGDMISALPASPPGTVFTFGDISSPGTLDAPTFTSGRNNTKNDKATNKAGDATTGTDDNATAAAAARQPVPMTPSSGADASGFGFTFGAPFGTTTAHRTKTASIAVPQPTLDCGNQKFPQYWSIDKKASKRKMANKTFRDSYEDGDWVVNWARDTKVFRLPFMNDFKLYVTLRDKSDTLTSRRQTSTKSGRTGMFRIKAGLRRCEECNADISDRPPSHYLCYPCFREDS